MASVARDKNSGNWLARWRDPGGRQRKKSFDRKADAQRWLDQMQAERHRGQYIDPRAATVRLEEIAEAWQAGLIHLKESTAFRYRGMLRLHVLPRFGELAARRPPSLRSSGLGERHGEQRPRSGNGSAGTPRPVSPG